VKFMQNSKVWSLEDTLAVYNSVQLKLKDPTKTQWKSEYVIPLWLAGDLPDFDDRFSTAKWESGGFSASHQGGQTQTLKAVKKIIAYMKHEMNVSISSSGISSPVLPTSASSPITSSGPKTPTGSPHSANLRRGTAPGGYGR